MFFLSLKESIGGKKDIIHFFQFLKYIFWHILFLLDTIYTCVKEYQSQGKSDDAQESEG